MPDKILSELKADQVMKIPVDNATADHGFYLWMIIGCSIGGAVIITLLIAAVIFLRRRMENTKNKKNLENSMYIPGAEFCRPQIVTSSFSSSSEDISETLSSQSSLQRELGPSMEYPTSIISTTSECVQPKPVITRWHSLESSHFQTATILGTLDINKARISDNEESGVQCLNGRLWFSLIYKSEEKRLQVTLIKVKHLTGRGLTNSPRDPFVKIYLLPDEENFHQSKIRKRTLSPNYNETFYFNVKEEEVAHKTLRFSVYDVDKRKIRHSLGHVMFPLARADMSSNIVIWKDLDTTSQQMSLLGEIQISLGCNPFTNRIKAAVGNLRNPHEKIADDAYLYVKVQLHHGHKLIKSKRTAPQKMTKAIQENKQELAFDETFHFAVSGRFFDSCSFTFLVMVAGSTPVNKDATHGKVVIGPFMYARGEQLLHWQEMLTNTRSIVTRWHSLEPVPPS